MNVDTLTLVSIVWKSLKTFKVIFSHAQDDEIPKIRLNTKIYNFICTCHKIKSNDSCNPAYSAWQKLREKDSPNSALGNGDFDRSFQAEIVPWKQGFSNLKKSMSTKSQTKIKSNSRISLCFSIEHYLTSRMRYLRPVWCWDLFQDSIGFVKMIRMLHEA